MAEIQVEVAWQLNSAPKDVS